jgi:hypothetical protein
VVADLALLGLGIALQPFRLSAFIMILATKGGTRKGLGFVFGWLACLVLVIAVVVLITAEAPADPHNLADQARHDVTMDRCGDSRHGSAMDTGGGRCHHRGPGQALHRRGLHCAALRTWLDTHGNKVIIVVCVVVGLWLTGQSIYALITA